MVEMLLSGSCLEPKGTIGHSMLVEMKLALTGVEAVDRPDLDA
jgi:hypothetical protein